MKFCQMTPPRLAGYLETSNTNGSILKIKGAKGNDLEVKPLKFGAFPLGVVAIRGRWLKQGGKNKSEVKWLVLIPWSSPACDGAGEVKGASLYEGYIPGRLSWGEGLEGILETPAEVYGEEDLEVRWGWLSWKRDGEKTSPLWTPHPLEDDVWARFARSHIHSEESRRWLKSRVSPCEVRGWLAVAPEVKASSSIGDVPDFGEMFGPPPGVEVSRDGGGFGAPPGPYSNPPQSQLLEDAARRSALAGEQGPPPAPAGGQVLDPNAPPF